MQKFIVYGGAGTAVVLALGVAFAPLISTITLGAPLIASIAAGIGGMASSMKLGVIASKALGVAMRGIPFVGIALAVYQIGSAMGIWEPIMNAVHRGAIKLAAGIQLLGLKIRWLWNVMTGDFDEADAMNKRMEEVESITAEMLKNVGKKQDEHLESTKENQAKLTSGVRKGAGERLAIEQESQKQIAKLPLSEDGKKTKDAEKPDEFGITPSERKTMDEELAKLDAVNAKKKGRQVKDVDFVVDPNSGHITSRATGDYSGLATRVENRISDLPKLDPSNSRSSSGDDKASKKTVEIKFPSASLHGDENSTEKVIADLQRMGAMA